MSIEQKVMCEIPGDINQNREVRETINTKRISQIMNNELLLQQNILQINHEKNDQMFRNIQLMQRNLNNEKYVDNRAKKPRGARGSFTSQNNQDTSLQHNQSSTSNQIKSNILQNYIQPPTAKNGIQQQNQTKQYLNNSQTIAEEF